ncbi:unnamed protein product [Orchesella dallaii]|uniref:Cation efflux protein transmembrane domain-containing protein n=1 Tax=Orchesella dallaii TaxID=48710 RepID=A0ABP1QML3_9HEXA
MMLPLTKKDCDDKPYKSHSRLVEKIGGWVRLIISDRDSRNLFFFLILNLSFAFVELFYGIWTNSLGLISDSFHMFFDCTGLVAGLIASIIAKWRPTDTFTYGFVRAEVLAGFLNGLFLLFIAFFILSEAVERLLEPPEVKHERLFLVSVLGLLVNLVGIYVFQHGGAHGHSHGGGGHGHSHGGGGHSHKHDDHNPSFLSHGHSHDGGHGHSHNGASHMHSHGGDAGGTGANKQIMRGVFLHILADTLGSVGVIISAGLMWAFEWYIADPICSICIALLISLSVLDLIKESGCILMQRTPSSIDSQLPQCYQRLMQLEGVVSVQEPHFWTLCSDVYVGSVKLEVSRNGDPRYITQNAQLIFQGIGVKKMTIQLDFLLT